MASTILSKTEWFVYDFWIANVRKVFKNFSKLYRFLITIRVPLVTPVENHKK